ncbi:MAG TPA: hypothetical protein VFU43_21890 [Streptosporangiaceae bacterium]|nr:hypothetical protein [Streptosporangiaceae bacterium]
MTARAAAGEVRLIGFLESLDRPARGGRVPGVAAAAARRTGLSFMFELRAGRIRPLRPAGGRAAAIDRKVRRCAGTGAGVADIVVLEAAPVISARSCANGRASASASDLI